MRRRAPPLRAVSEASTGLRSARRYTRESECMIKMSFRGFETMLAALLLPLTLATKQPHVLFMLS